MELNREQIAKALETLDKMDFFQGQRAGRELWFDKPFEVQEQDITDFSKGIEFVKNVITDALALIRELTEENEGLRAQVEQSEITTKDLRSRNHEFTRANMSLSRYADELQLELAECTQIKADTVRKMQERLKECFYCDSENIRNTDAYVRDVIDQIAKEMLEEAK